MNLKHNLIAKILYPVKTNLQVDDENQGVIVFDLLHGRLSREWIPGKVREGKIRKGEEKLRRTEEDHSKRVSNVKQRQGANKSFK